MPDSFARGSMVPDHSESVTGPQVRSILEHAFSGLGAVVSATPLKGGSINATFQVELRDQASVILRVAPSDSIAAAGPSWLTPWGLRREEAVIALAKPALGPLLPKTIAADFDRTVIDRDWVIQERMAGVPLSTIDAALSRADRTALWSELGQLTRRLHAVPGERFGVPIAGLQFDRLSDLLRNDADGLLDDAERFDLPPAPFRRLRDRIDEWADILDDSSGARLIHSDLARSHVFVARDGTGPYRVCGIIDLEFGRFADPQFERMITSFQWGNAPREMKDAFFAGYGRHFHTPEDRQRLHVYVALALAWSATILAFQGRRDALPPVIARMEEALARSE